MFRTGIKAIDLFAPWSAAARQDCSAAPASAVPITELINNVVGRLEGVRLSAASASAAGGRGSCTAK